MTRYIKVQSAAPPPPTARYSHAVESQGFLHVTGQLPIDPDAPNAVLPATIEGQTELAFRNLKLIDRDYVGLISVYHRYFDDDEALPARTTVGVARLGRKALVEIEMILAQSVDQ
jgi:2-iminobutanoate/2-iminopropanoate deaminase